MDERLSLIRSELDAGAIAPQSLVLLFNTASDADHAGDLATLEETLALAEAIAQAVGEPLRAEAKRLATICDESLASVRQRHGRATEPAGGMLACPDCGNELPANALRCRRCGHRFF